MKQDVFRLFVVLTFSGLLCAIVLVFEYLDYEQHISRTNYAGLFWQEGNQGSRAFPPSDSCYPYSGTHNLTNTWGCILIGIQFANPFNVIGSYLAGQGSDSGVWTTVMSL